jgi:SPP1 family predicted phage head-tail adaptor
MNKNIRVQLQSATITRSATGAEVKEWATYATVMGSIKTLRGAAYYAQEQTANEITIEMYIWYRTDILPKHRAVIGCDTYEIAAPPENLNLQNREMLLRLRRVE